MRSRGTMFRPPCATEQTDQRGAPADQARLIHPWRKAGGGFEPALRKRGEKFSTPWKKSAFFSTEWKKFSRIFHAMEKMFERHGKRLAGAWVAAGLAWALTSCRSLPAPSLAIPRTRQWKVTASAWEPGGEPRRAVDGRTNTWWRSGPEEPQWFQVDFPHVATVCGFSLQWGEPHATAYAVQTSLDGVDWAVGYETTNGDGDWDQGAIEPTDARHVRIMVLKGRQGTGAALSRLEIKGLETQPAFFVEDPSGHYIPAPGTAAMLDGKLETVWRCTSAVARLRLDLRRIRPVGSLRVDWGAQGYASNVMVEVSTNGTNWVSAGLLQAPEGDFDVLMAETVQPAQYLQLTFSGASVPAGFEVAEITLRGREGVADAWSRYELAAAKATEGVYPDALRNRQNHWALAGGMKPGDAESLLDEWGIFAPNKNSPTLAPLLLSDGAVRTAYQADQVEHRLGGLGAPMPETVWNMSSGLSLRIRALVKSGTDPALSWVQYELANDALATQTGRLCWVVRPVRLPPRWAGGGLAHILRIRSNRAAGGWQEIRLNGEPVFAMPEQGLSFGAAAFEDGDVAEWFLRGKKPPSRMAWDENGLASAAWWLDFSLGPGTKTSLVVAAYAQTGAGQRLRRIPWPEIAGGPGSVSAAFAQAWEDSAKSWREATGGIQPQIARPEALACLRAQVGWLLASRTGAGIAGGEDLESISFRVAALLRAGQAAVARGWIDQVGASMQPNGWVPARFCAEGRLDVPDGREGWHASQGQFAFMVLEYWRFTHDLAFLEERYPQLTNALGYLATLRAELEETEWRLPDRERELVEGLLPPRVVRDNSPAIHPYVDQYWALLGWKELKAAAAVLGRNEDAMRAGEHYRALHLAVQRSLRERMDRMEDFWIPAAAEDERLDIASVALLFWPCEETGLVEPHELQTSLDTSYEGFLSRRQPERSGRVVPGNEARLLTPLADMGRGDYAREVLYELLNRRQPAGWQVWADAQGGDPRQPGVAGTMPDIRAAAAYVIGLRGLAARETGKRLDLFSGAPAEWLQHGDGFAVTNLPTEFGLLDLSGHWKQKQFTVEIGGTARPPGGYRLWWPRQILPERVLANGRPLKDFTGQGVELPHDFKGRVEATFPYLAPWPRDP